MTSFRILSHACLLVESDGIKVIIDPWLIGSCYWKSWNNFPRAVFDEDELRSVEYVVISHIHWDHWHGLTIRKYFRDKTFIIPDEPNLRSEADLRAIGVKKIMRAGHGKEVRLSARVRIFLYQFGLFLNDAAIVVETADARLLDANDAKLAGAPLKQIIRKHGPFDFVFRSHSSANSRICFNVRGAPVGRMDDPEHYARVFVLFMRAVQPRYAVPFASNHCHLHRDTFKFNHYITNPLMLSDFVQRTGGLGASELKVMLPGSGWNSERGFDVVEPTCFRRLDEALEEYRRAEDPSLTAFYEKEDHVRIDDALLRRFDALHAGIPRLLLIRLKGLDVVFEVVFPSKASRFLLWRLGEPVQELGTEVAQARMESAAGVIRIPAIVLRDAILRNMFSQAMISKRMWVEAKDERTLRVLMFYTQTLLHWCELGVFPLTLSYAKRLAATYLIRWRELGVYVHAAVLKFVYRKPGWDIEEKILSRSRLSR